MATSNIVPRFQEGPEGKRLRWMSHGLPRKSPEGNLKGVSGGMNGEGLVESISHRVGAGS